MNDSLKMTINKIPFEQTGFFSDAFLDFMSQKEDLKPFYGAFPSFESYDDQIKFKSASYNNSIREVLKEELYEQYKDMKLHENVVANINTLELVDTFTITTGHQLNIFSGPLYFIYKIITVINTARALQQRYPDKRFVPVYWMASEDHDFEEISYFNLFGKKYQWHTEQTGAVGRFSTESIRSLFEQLPEKAELFEKAYLEHSTLSQATRYFVNELFGEYGLVVLDADSRSLKKCFTDIVEDDILHNTSYKLVAETNNRLEKAGYKPQINVREINFFYLDEGLRERIVKEDGVFKVLNTSLVFSEDEIKEHIVAYPEKFSPNVALRPIYQEVILPNLSYTGGPAEIIYWMQLKDVFENYQIPFPILLPRSFALVINKNNIEKLNKLGLSIEDIFKSELELKEEYLNKLSDGNWALEVEKEKLIQIFANLKTKAAEADKTLEGMIGAEEAKALKSIEHIEKRLKKAEEQKLETALNRVATIKNKLFPNGGLQERNENFLNFYLNNPLFIHQLAEVFDPFAFSFLVMTEDE